MASAPASDAGAAGPARADPGRADLRERRAEGRESNLVLFVVDASGSMAARRRMEAVKGAVLSLLLDAYQRRDKVGLICFRGAGAQVLLPPTSSVDAAARRLETMPDRRADAAGGRAGRGARDAAPRAAARSAAPAAAGRRHRRPSHRGRRPARGGGPVAPRRRRLRRRRLRAGPVRLGLAAALAAHARRRVPEPARPVRAACSARALGRTAVRALPRKVA